MKSGFGARARAAMDAYGPLCVGIDPHAALIEEWGLPDSVEGLERFAATCVEAFAGHVAFVKPQSAFFERFGAGGVAVLERTIQDLRHTGTLVLLDVKRGDIGSTAAAYAEAYLDEDSPMCADAVTVSPYLGFGSLEPFFETAERNDTGVFVLALTSNPEGPQVQRARQGDTEGTVAGSVLAQLKALNGDRTPMGPFGAVIGATLETLDEDVAFNGPILAPGLGAQGGTADDVARLFGPVADRVLPSTSRGVLKAGPDPAALRDSAAQVNAELVRSLEMYRTSRSPA
ncbi:orotidine-5'-phosphate decarboxylase [Aeromicrobium terrae]|uniref:Orotidine 5'-phosphate decarboxylase n=1 Tax=Aeromicrobium terrae TaxID=2498846 RepID=A0A5C8NPE0_9ACTN|nr:orotidine-5'-phosphate decarboxylase [Aeromicrobium terrae]TXL62987.1 orotidine-5'-phosphate decarboxylase [Aeromicrobium terrae]